MLQTSAVQRMSGGRTEIIEQSGERSEFHRCRSSTRSFTVQKLLEVSQDSPSTDVDALAVKQ